MSNTPGYSGHGRGSRSNTGSPQTYGSPDFQPRDYSSPSFNQFSNRRGRNSRFYQSNSRSPHYRRGNSNKNERKHGKPESEEDRQKFINSLVHWSMTEDPWEKLRKKLESKNSKNNQPEDADGENNGSAALQS